MIDRRNFIKSSSVITAGMAVAPLAGSSVHVSATETVNMGLIGCRNRGNRVMSYFLSNPGVRCSAVCDIDQDILRSTADKVAKIQGRSPDMYDDYRKILDRKDIDAVLIATPDHWHCLQFVDACKAGKDIYVEKPIANSIAECDAMVAATQKYNRIVQVGQQQRSSEHWKAMVEYLKSGKLGKIGRVHVWANFNYGVISTLVPDSEVPEGIDFNTWLGPAPRIPFNMRKYRSWRMFWDYGGGLMTDWGVHLIDMALWGMDVKTMPLFTVASGGNYLFPDGAQETFDTMSVTYQFKDFIVEWENNAGVETGPYGKNYGLLFRGTNGTLVADRTDWEIYPEKDKIPVEKFVADNKDAYNHVTNFLDCVKSRNPVTACPVENGSICAKYAHLGNIGARVGGKTLVYDDRTKKFNIPEAGKYLQATYRSPWTFPKV